MPGETERRKRVEQVLQSALRRLQLQLQAVGTLSQAEEMLAGDVEGLARKVTELAAAAIGCERVNVWLFDANEAVLRCIDLFEATPSRHSAGMVLEEREYLNEFQALKTSKYVNADDPLTDPRTAGYVATYVAPLRITSMLDTVIQISGKHLGLLCFEHVDTPHHWEQDEISFAGQLADKLGLALLSRMRRQAEAELRASESRFRTIFNTVSDAIFVHDIRTGALLDANTSATELFGYTREEILSGDAEMAAADDVARLAAARAGEAPTFERHYKSRDGRSFWGEVSLSRATFGAQEVVLATVRDISERKKRAEELQATAAELNEAQHLARLGSWSWDPRSNRITWSDELYRIAGRDPRLPAPTLEEQAAFFKPRSHAAVIAALNQCAESGTPYVLDLEFVGEDGRAGWILARGEAEHGDDGVERVRGTVLDITERKQAENELRQVQDALAEAQAVAHVGSWQLELPGSRLTWSDESFRIFGDDPATSSPSFEVFLQRIHPGDRVLLAEAFRRSLEDRVPYDLEHRIVRDDGTVRIVHVRGRTFYGADGKPQRTIGTVQDVTRWKEAEAALIQERDFSTALIDSLPGLFLLIDEEGRLARWNESLPRRTGLSDEQLDRLEAVSLVVESDRETARATLQEAFGSGRSETEFGVRTKDGDTRTIQWTGRRITSGGRTYVLSVGSDITERKQAEARIRSMARHDVLTGLANRAVFVEALQRAIAYSRRAQASFAVLYLDLDHFKDVNDTLGHPVGDLLLQAIAHRLNTAIRDVDTVARFGGDEFAIIETNLRDPSDAAVLADKVLKAIGEPFSIQGNEIRAGTSVGIAVYGPDSPDAEELLSHADVALYRAKSEGRGTYRFFTDSMDEEVRARVSLGAELRAALASEQFFLLYQPQVDVETGRIVGLEALLRWLHPKRGLVPPCEFIAVAERCGLIVALGRWVLHEACRQMKEWIDAGSAPPLIAVNVSGLQFKTPDELEHVIATTLAETSLRPELLELELTETVLMEASGDVLVRLRKAGVRIAIDDFGNGYSSLGHLSRFPVDRIKIAQNFIFDLTTQSGNAAIVKAAIGLAHELGLDVVVEGVETAEQLEIVRSWGAREAQGFYFSRPLPAGEVQAVLRAGSVLPSPAYEPSRLPVLH